MAKSTPTPDTPAERRVRLLAPHEHAGRDYPAGAELTLPEDAAAWLVGLKRAEPLDPQPAA